jgi:hypothetical protein
MKIKNQLKFVSISLMMYLANGSDINCKAATMIKAYYRYTNSEKDISECIHLHPL